MIGGIAVKILMALVVVGLVAVVVVGPVEGQLPSFNPGARVLVPKDGCPADIVNTTAAEAIPAQGENVRVYVTSISIMNNHASVGTVVHLLDGATVRWRCYAAPAGGGCVVPFPSPLEGSPDTAWNFINVTTGANVIACASGYIPR